MTSQVRVLCEPQPGIPLVDLEVVLSPGASGDPTDREGLVWHAAELMARGAGPWDREALDLAFEELGTGLEVETSHESVSFSVRTLKRNLPQVVPLLAALFAAPRLEESEHGKLLKEQRALLDEIWDRDESLAGRCFQRECLAGHSYGRTVLGTAASMERIEHSAVLRWVDGARTAQALFGIAGDITPAEADVLAQDILGSLSCTTAAPRASASGPPFANERRLLLIDKPDRSQCHVLMGHPAPPRAHADWLALHVATTLFGGLFSSRLVREVRVKRGWSYDVSARIGRGRLGHTFRMEFEPAVEQTADTLTLVRGLFQEFVEQGADTEELELAKSYLEGRFAFTQDTAGHRLNLALDEVLLGMAPGTFARYREDLAAVTLENVNAAIREHLRPDALLTVLTGTADDIGPALAPLGLGAVQVVPYQEY